MARMVLKETVMGTITLVVKHVKSLEIEGKTEESTVLIELLKSAIDFYLEEDKQHLQKVPLIQFLYPICTP